MTYHFDGGGDFVVDPKLHFDGPLPKLIIQSSLKLERIKFILSHIHKLVVMRDKLCEVQFERL